MGPTEIIALLAVVVGLFGAIGGVVKWAAGRFDVQAAKLHNLELEYAKLYREHSIVLVKLERTRLAFQMVATELARKSPGNSALALAASLLDEAFKIDPKIPPEMQAALDKIG